MTEYRSAPDSAKVVDPSKHEVLIDAPVYNILDDYRTAWRPGVFAESIARRTPSLVWAHDWRDPIGAFKDADDNAERLRVVYKLDDFDAVPRARQAFAQFQSGTIRDASFGFSRVEGGDEPYDGEEGAIWFNRANLDEHSPVLIGAVPGAKIAGVRHISAAEVLRLSHELEAGEITLDDALSAVTRIAMADEVRATHTHAKQDGSGTVSHSHQNDAVGGAHAHSGLMPVTLTAGRAAPYVAEPDETVKCPNCGAMNEPDAQFCDQCGAELSDEGRALLMSEARALLADIER